MSAFGFGGSMEPEPSTQAQSGAPASDAVASGMLDMSAFGFGGAAGPEPQVQHWQSAANPLASGMLDMSAFGFDMGGSSEAEPRAHASGFAGLTGVGSGRPHTASALRMDRGGFGSFDQADTSSLPMQAASSSAAGLSASAEGPLAASVGPGGTPTLLFPRVAEPSPDGALPGLLLTGTELQQLRELLGVAGDGTLLGAGVDGAVDGADGSATLPVSLLPSYLRDDSAEQKAARAAALRKVLDLTPEHARQLLLLAWAMADGGPATTAASLSNGTTLPTPPASALGPGASVAEAMSSLDLPGRVFLATVRLAGAVGKGPAAGGVVSGRAGGAQEAAALFKPTSVVLSRTPSKASDVADGLGPRSPSGMDAPPRSMQQQQQQGQTQGQGQGQGARARPRQGTAPGGRGGTSGTVSSSRQAGGATSPTMRSILSFSSIQHTPAGPAGLGGKGTAAAGTGESARPASLAGGLQLSGSFRSSKGSLASGRTWQDALGVLPALPATALLWAQASACQAGSGAGAGAGAGALPLAALAAVPMQAGEEERVSPDAGGAGFRSVAQSMASAAAASTSASAVSWPQLRGLGAGLWLVDAAAARAVAELLARSQFSRHRDPYECALMYLALGKRAVLQSLFRQANNVRIADFLARDFSREDGKRAAAKNAFALLGQHRYELAAAFFILAGQHWDAVSGGCGGRLDGG